MLWEKQMNNPRRWAFQIKFHLTPNSHLSRWRKLARVLLCTLRGTVDRWEAEVVSALLSSVLIFTFLHPLISVSWWWSFESLIQTVCLSLELVHLLLSLTLLQIFPFNAMWMPTIPSCSSSSLLHVWWKLLINDSTSRVLLSSGRLIDAIVVMVCDDDEVGDWCSKYPKVSVVTAFTPIDELQRFISLSMGISTCTLFVWLCLWNCKAGLRKKRWKNWI